MTRTHSLTSQLICSIQHWCSKDENQYGWLELMSFIIAKVISGWPVLLVEETGVPRGNHQHTLGNDNYSTCTRTGVWTQAGV